MNFHDDLKVSPYSSIAFWVRYFFFLHWEFYTYSPSEMVNLENISASRWDKLLDDTLLNGEVEGKKMRTCYLFFRTLTEITLYQNLLSFSGEILQWLQKNFGKKFSLTKVSRKCLWAEKFSSYPLPETAKEWIISPIKQSKPPPLFWVFMFVFQVTIDQYQACQCGWLS